MKYTEFFTKRIPNLSQYVPNEKGDVMVPCVFHVDSSPSLSINLETSQWRCFAAHCAGHKGGKYKVFDKLLNGEVTAGTNAAIDHPSQFIEPAAVEGYHRVLLQTSATLELLQNKRGLSLATIKKYKLGFDSDRIWIPIQNEAGDYVNVRKYKPGAKKDKMVAYGPGYNKARLFPVHNLKHETVVLCEGEMDNLLCEQYGFHALTTTGGADTWVNDFTALLRGKTVYICYDVDPAGKAGARAVAMKLLAAAKAVYIVTLPLPGTKEEKDITNFFVDLGHTKEDFQGLLDSAELILPAVAAVAGPPAEVFPVHLSEVGEDKFVNKRVSSTVLIAGKDLAPFQVPYKIGYQCEMGDKICHACGICKAGGQMEVTVPEWDPNFLQMVGVHQLSVERVIAQLAKVPGGCQKFKYEVKEFANLESVKAIPEIDFASERSEYVIRQLFYLGHGLETNHTYDIEAVVMPDPKTQYATAIIYDAKPSQDSIEKFELTEDTLALLNMFKVA